MCAHGLGRSDGRVLCAVAKAVMLRGLFEEDYTFGLTKPAVCSVLEHLGGMILACLPFSRPLGGGVVERVKGGGSRGRRSGGLGTGSERRSGGDWWLSGTRGSGEGWYRGISGRVRKSGDWWWFDARRSTNGGSSGARDSGEGWYKEIPGKVGKSVAKTGQRVISLPMPWRERTLDWSGDTTIIASPSSSSAVTVKNNKENDRGSVPNAIKTPHGGITKKVSWQLSVQYYGIGNMRDEERGSVVWPFDERNASELEMVTWEGRRAVRLWINGGGGWP